MYQPKKTVYYKIYDRNSSEDSINNDNLILSEKNINERTISKNIVQINQINNIEQNIDNFNGINEINNADQDSENNNGINEINFLGQDLVNLNGINNHENENNINSKEDNKIDIIDDQFILKNKIYGICETKVGAHYYAYTPYSTEYSKVSGLIKLPESINTNYGQRNAYISFGVLGINKGINIGLINSGKGGWRPLQYFHKTQKMVCYNEYHSNEKTDYIEIIIEVTQDRQLLATFNLKNSTFLTIKSLNFRIDVSKFLEYENGKVKLRFYRFASLVPLEEDNQNDGTFVKKGKFIGLNIVKNNKTESWGISEDNIEGSWIISSKRIRVDYKKSEESFSIIHNKDPF